MGNRYTYTRNFRREAGGLARTSNRHRYKIAGLLGVCDGALASWVKDIDRDEEPGALSRDERAELERLCEQAWK